MAVIAVAEDEHVAAVVDVVTAVALPLAVTVVALGTGALLRVGVTAAVLLPATSAATDVVIVAAVALIGAETSL